MRLSRRILGYKARMKERRERLFPAAIEERWSSWGQVCGEID
jgi:hypothetical protein